MISACEPVNRTEEMSAARQQILGRLVRLTFQKVFDEVAALSNLDGWKIVDLLSKTLLFWLRDFETALVLPVRDALNFKDTCLLSYSGEV